MIKKYPFHPQLDSLDCGPACLRMTARYYGKKYTAKALSDKSHRSQIGTSLSDLCDAAESIGFRAIMARVSLAKIKDETPLPLIAHWKNDHFVVVYECTKKHVLIGDPGFGLIKCSHEEFEKKWHTQSIGRTPVGVVLLLETTREFYASKDEDDAKKWGLPILLTYLKPFYKLLGQILIGMLAGSALQLFFPLMTQAIVDKGIGGNNFNFVQLVIIAQLVLLLSRLVIDLIQNRIFLFMNGKISISLLSDFLIKLMKLPISFFDSRNTGDILQRLADNGKIQGFLTGTTLSVLLSVFNLFFFGIILGFYSTDILVVYIIGSIIHTVWVVVFLRKRRELNYKMFDNASKNQNVLIQLINGMREIKLHNSERLRRWEWERTQTRAYKLGLKNLNLNQLQQTGAFFINESKNVIITFMTVTSVMNGEVTLGMMMSIQYIIGSLNGPVSSLIGLIQTIQDVKISLERMGEIHHKENEENSSVKSQQKVLIPSPIAFEGVCFQYGGKQSPEVLKDIWVEIPNNKITAIVGASGSGKSTLLKMMLRLYEPTTGNIHIGGRKLNTIEHRFWRSRCASVMQDGYIFSDTIANNITMHSDDEIDFNRLDYSIEVANVREYIDSLPNGYNSKIGDEGIGLSQGQRQRILIARAVYKDPEYIFLDEATNALDSTNESTIMQKLNSFFLTRTVVIVAHRLSTVVHADKILVLDKGRIEEHGSHLELIAQKGLYYELIRNQLDLGQ